MTKHEKTIAAEKNIKVTYTRLIFDCYVFVVSFRLSYINILFFHIQMLLKVKVTYIQGDLEQN